MLPMSRSPTSNVNIARVSGALMKITSSEAMSNIKEFFPTINNDLTNVTWAHYVHDDKSFQHALEDAKSLGVKLNFDKINVFGKSIKVLQAMSGELKFPVWLHGITDNMEEKDIDEFLSLCTLNFPEATISIGMLHKGQTLKSNEGYNAKLVTQMKDTLIRNNVTQTVAFPVEMFRAAYSLDTLPALKDVHGITDSALYMYAKLPGFKVDELSRLSKLIKIFGKDRVYLDAIVNKAYLLSPNPINNH
uniref:Menorin-like domain-containing protein n=1 Tax=Timema bartmani TaxID=61472 RepID=A0A7R9F7W8_9NEOP|nr:unnamed protein product [Timema bartmani]